MSFFAVYIPPSKAGFEGTTEQCAGSIAAEHKRITPASEANDSNATKFEDPEYPPDSPLWLIFTDKSKALELLRHYKEARLREFPNREKAESYVQFGFESIESLKRYGKAKPTKPVQLPAALGIGFKTSAAVSDSPFSSSLTNNANSMPCSTVTLSNMVISKPSNSGSNCIVTVGNGSSVGSPCSSLSAERPPFRAPTKQELVEFRKQIEVGNYDRIKRIVWDNPRFLISIGDTPTSLKEGYRYNAMHICAQGNQALVAELILRTISDRDFTQLYAGKKSSSEMCIAMNENLLDYYLNMPDKGRGETPLHFAVKNAHIAIVEVLTSYPQCKSLKNTEGMYPKDIICQRAPTAGPDVFKKLELLLSEPHYVPVLRAAHNELPPHIGQPFTPNDPPILQYRTDESDRLNVDFTISALAGPMPREQAFHFFRRWKTPPRIGSNVISPLTGSPFISPMKTPSQPFSNKRSEKMSTGRRVLFNPTTSNKTLNELNANHKSEQAISLQNCDMGHIENNNNNNCAFKDSSNATISNELPSTPIRQMRPDLFLEYRTSNLSPHLDESPDRAPDFRHNVSNLNDSFRERHIKNSDIEKGLEVVGRQLARQEQLEWREYWDFLDSFVDIASSNGLSRLESYLSAQLERSHTSILSEKSDHVWNLSQMRHYLDLISDRSKTSNFEAGGGVITQVMTPYTCVEKSLQVFAKRITKTIINNINNMVSINDKLLSELKRLKSLIVSFKDDARFFTVDFSKVHSRIAHLVVSYIAHSMEVSAALRYQLLQILHKLTQMNGDRREHLNCVCASMLLILERVSTVHLPDALKTEELCSVAWQMELCCACLWDANLSRKTSRRKRAESLRVQVFGKATTTPTAAAVTLHSPGMPNVAVVYPVAKTGSYRNSENHSDDDDIDSDDEMFFYDCDGGDKSEDEDIFLTPPESRSPRLACDLEPRYELFIYGKEPTKRDLDVLNAICHAKIEKESLPFVHAWRTAMENFSTAEMDLFPSPKNVQKMHNSKVSSIVADCVSLVLPKRLFSTPKLNTVAIRPHSVTPSTPPKPTCMRENCTPLLDSKPMDSMSPMPSLPMAAVPSVSLSYQTPISKMRGLFSNYRETRQEPSPVTFLPDINNDPNKSLFMEESD